MAHAYQIIVGSYELPITYGDDVRARKVAERWIALFWERRKTHVAKNHTGSMADAEDNAWYSVPECKIYRSAALCSAGIIPAKPWTILEHFSLEKDAILEFSRIARKRYKKAS